MKCIIITQYNDLGNEHGYHWSSVEKSGQLRAITIPISFYLLTVIFNNLSLLCYNGSRITIIM